MLLWGWFTGFAALNLYISELIEYNSDLERASYDVHLWHFLGALTFVAVWTVIGAGAITTALLNTTCADDSARATPAFLISGYYALLFYVMICTFGFYQPFTQYRRLKLAKGGLVKGQDHPVRLGCMRSVNPMNMTVPGNVSYFSLEDPEWVVDHSVRKTTYDEDWEYSIAPLVYHGSVVGCRFEPQIYVTCIAQKPTTPEKCYYGAKQTGAYTAMRRLWASDYVDLPERKKMDKFKIPRHNIFEYNSPSLAEVTEFISKKEEQREEMWRKACIAWSVCSLFGLLVYMVAVLVIACAEFGADLTIRKDKKSRTEEIEMQSESSEPPRAERPRFTFGGGGGGVTEQAPPSPCMSAKTGPSDDGVCFIFF